MSAVEEAVRIVSAEAALIEARLAGPCPMHPQGCAVWADIQADVEDVTA